MLFSCVKMYDVEFQSYIFSILQFPKVKWLGVEDSPQRLLFFQFYGKILFEKYIIWKSGKKIKIFYNTSKNI